MDGDASQQSNVCSKKPFTKHMFSDIIMVKLNGVVEYAQKSP